MSVTVEMAVVWHIPHLSLPKAICVFYHGTHISQSRYCSDVSTELEFTVVHEAKTSQLPGDKNTCIFHVFGPVSVLSRDFCRASRLTSCLEPS